MPTLRPTADRPLKEIDGGPIRPLRLAATVVCASCLLALSVPAQGVPIGTWQLRTEGTVDVKTVELRLETRRSGEGRDETSVDVPLASLAGLTREAVTGADGEVRFQLVRDAGTFSCEGRAGRGLGAGTFEFTPDPTFGAQLAKRGYERPTAIEQLEMALNDVGYAVVDELQTEGYTRPSIAELVEVGMHDAGLDFLRGLDALGYRLGDVDRLIELRDHDVTPDYIRALASAGYPKLSSRELLTLRDHGVTPRYIADLARIGYTGLSTDDLLQARDHGVSASWTEGFQQAGYTQLTMRELVELRDHGVTAAFASHLHRDGAPLPTVRELINRRDRNDD
jgi:hypothetical protein